MKNIGFIGTGIMGKPMAKNLIKAGYRLVVFARKPKKITDLKAEGAIISPTIGELSGKSSVIITMLPDSPESLEVITGPEGIIQFAGKGTVVVDMSSIDPIVSKEIGRKLEEKDIDFLDAPVSGGEAGAVDGTLAIMAGGNKKVFDRILPLFKAMGSSYKLLGENGAGNFTKLANQIIVASNIAAVSEAFILAKKAGLSLEKVHDAIRGGMAGSRVLDSKAPMIIEGKYDPGFKIKLHRKDLQNVLNAGNFLDVPLPLSGSLLEILKSLDSKGYGQLDHSAIAKFFQAISGVELQD